MTEKYSIYIISSYEYNVKILLKISKEPNYYEIQTYFSNYLDL
jgi:hypothetical protein